MQLWIFTAENPQSVGGKKKPTSKREKEMDIVYTATRPSREIAGMECRR